MTSTIWEPPTPTGANNSPGQTQPGQKRTLQTLCQEPSQSPAHHLLNSHPKCLQKPPGDRAGGWGSSVGGRHHPTAVPPPVEVRMGPAGPPKPVPTSPPHGGASPFSSCPAGQVVATASPPGHLLRSSWWSRRRVGCEDRSGHAPSHCRAQEKGGRWVCFQSYFNSAASHGSQHHISIYLVMTLVNRWSWIAATQRQKELQVTNVCLLWGKPGWEQGKQGDTGSESGAAGEGPPPHLLGPRPWDSPPTSRKGAVAVAF